jgi:hypothetical protein
MPSPGFETPVRSRALILVVMLNVAANIQLHSMLLLLLLLLLSPQEHGGGPMIPISVQFEQKVRVISCVVLEVITVVLSSHTGSHYCSSE